MSAWAAAAGALLCVPLLSLPLLGCSPGAEGEGYVVLDATARRAGLAVEVDGEPHAGPLPALVPEGASVVLTGPERREAIEVGPGELVSVRGAGGLFELERGAPDREKLRFRSAEGPARAFAERTGARLVREAPDRWLLEGADILSIAALFEEAKGIAAVQPIYADPPSAGGRRGAAPVLAAKAPRSATETAEEETALSALLLEEAAREPAAEDARREREQIERDLELTLTLSGRRVFTANETIPLHLALTNRAWSKRWLVEPGDGSDVGWREPYVFYTAQREERSGVWVDVPKQSFGRCGNFDERWDEDVIALLPGASMEIKHGVLPPEVALDLEGTGKVRLYAHYAYRAGQGGDSFMGRGARVPRELEGVPAYELVSAPVEIEITRPLDLVLSVTGPLRAGAGAKMDELFAVSLVNRSAEAFPLPDGEKDAQIYFSVEGEGFRSGTTLAPLRFERRGGQGFGPGASVDILTRERVTADIYPPPGREESSVRVRATVMLWGYGDGPYRLLKSSWVTASLE